ncbi:MAG: hypothetical protein ACWA42_05255 [Lutibacter sp.]
MSSFTWLLLFLGILLSILLVTFQYFKFLRKEGTFYYVLSFFRFITYLIVFILLINPSVYKSTSRIVKPILKVIIDNSKSIKYLKSDSTSIRIAKQIANNKDLKQKFNIKYYTLNKQISHIDTINYNLKRTNFSTILNENNNTFLEKNKAQIVISDGNENYGSINNVKEKLQIYPVIIGDTTHYDNLKISKINCNDQTTKNSLFPVEIFLNYSGTKKIKKKLSISHHNKAVFNEKLEFSKSKNTLHKIVYLKAQTIGVQNYVAKIESILNEKNKLDNVAYFKTNITEQPIKIGIISKFVYPDLGALKSAISKKLNYKVDLITNLNKNMLLNDYQLLIIYQPTSDFSAIFNKINQLKLNYLVISGKLTNWNYLNSVQNSFKKDILNQNSNLFLAKQNEQFNLLSLPPILFNDLPPLNSFNGKTEWNIPYKTVLFKKYAEKPLQIDEPLFSIGNKQNQKIGLWDGENIWKWRIALSKENKLDLFDTFFQNTIQYLISKKSNSRYRVYAKPVYQLNEPIKINLTYYNENEDISTENQFKITVYNQQKNTVINQDFYIVNHSFVNEIIGLKPGKYQFKIKESSGKTIYNNSFTVNNYELEKLKYSSNFDFMQQIATNAKHQVYFPNSTKTLISDLLSNNSFKKRREVHKTKENLIDLKWLLIILTISLTIEWFVRKYNGLL